jgi:Abnormal spindle-like microcephaly-assoc'd, ASPM-SPD-2-Hydin
VTLNVQFDPAAAGAATGQLTIQSNSSTNSTAVVNLSGTGTVVLSPQLTVSATSLTFGNVTENTASTLPVTLTSTGTAPVTINSGALSGAGYTVSGATFPMTLNPTQAVILNVQFDPTTAGAATGQLTIQSNSSTNGTAVISLTGTGTVVPGALSSLSCSSGSMTGSGSDACTVTLSTAAGSGGLSVGLMSSNAAVAVPATVMVPANASSVAFTATVTSVTTAQAVTLTASAGSVSKSFALQLNAAVPTLTISTASLTFGNVAENTPSTLPVTLTSTGTAPVTINSAALSGAGYTVSGATFPVTLTPNLAITLQVQFDPTATGAVTGQLTIQSNSSTNGTAVISLTGTGTAVSHQVNLSWQAPSDSTDSIAGYNVYRSAGGSSGYQLLNSSVDIKTTYVDSTVQAGLTYDYIVESVDSSGAESTASNEVTVTIP